MFLLVSVHFGKQTLHNKGPMYMTEKTSRNMPKTLLTTFWQPGDVMIASSLTRWQSFQLKRCSQAQGYWLQANGRTGEGVVSRTRRNSVTA